MPPTLTRMLLSLLIAYGAYGLLAFFFQRSLIFPGTRIVTGDLPPPRGVQRLWLDSPAGKVEAFYLPADAASAEAPLPLMLISHGNYELIDHWPEQVRPLLGLGVGVLLVEYPGYGRSEGSPSEAAIAASLALAHDWAAARPEVDGKRIVALGRSLGGGAACSLVGKRPLAALILQSTFSSLRPFVHGMLLPSLILRDSFDNEAAVASFDGPVLIFHGKRDDVIPYAHAKTLVSAAHNVRFVTYDCAHNDCPPDFDAFWQTVADFLKAEGVLN